ncbi:MAG: hypothetical protein LBD53_02755 [Tannerella sp.]|nr:hypothetical protein [Tannerella sp.]
MPTVVGFSMTDYAVSQGRHFVSSISSVVPCGTLIGGDRLCRMLKHTVNKVSSLRDCVISVRHCEERSNPACLPMTDVSSKPLAGFKTTARVLGTVIPIRAVELTKPSSRIQRAQQSNPRRAAVKFFN